MKQTGILFIILTSCSSTIDKTKWPFPEARKCAEYYKDMADLYFETAKTVNKKMKVTPVDLSIDSLIKVENDLNKWGKVYSDSSYYFYAMIDGE